MVQLSHPYMTRKTIALIRHTFVSKVISLFYNMLSSEVLRPGALGRAKGIGSRGRWEGGSEWGIHVNPWLIHVNV